MAIKKTVILDDGETEVVDAVHKLWAITVDTRRGYCYLDVSTHVSVEDAAANINVLRERRFPWQGGYEKAGVDNAHTQGYEHLKTMPEFADAEDC